MRVVNRMRLADTVLSEVELKDFNDRTCNSPGINKFLLSCCVDKLDRVRIRMCVQLVTVH